MELADALRRRRMVRSYRPDPVDPAAVERVLRAALHAPSAGFSQPHRFVVITSEERRRAVAEACGEPEAVARGLSPWLSVAPVHVVPCVEPAAYARRYAEPDKAASRGPEGWEVPFQWVDGGAALMALLLAAVDEGLGAGFLDVDHAALRRAVDVPDPWVPLGLVTLGHPADSAVVGSAARRQRLDVADVTMWC
jgi:nitroreductase